jgi:hypothetical protein
MDALKILPSSFRDPSGSVFSYNGQVFRQVNFEYKNDYDLLISSGLYSSLISNKLLISHREVQIETPFQEKAYKVLRPVAIPFISYPYEWCFSQLKAAALTTLKVQKIALKYKMSLKDSSAYNIQFLNGKPLLIDSLSFETYTDGKPWKAYKQFCQHFFCPLVLIKYTDMRLNLLSKIFIDGIPIDLARKLLPLRSFFNPSVFMHVFLHSMSQKYYSSRFDRNPSTFLSQNSFKGIIDNLENYISKISWKSSSTEWSNYYGNTDYSPEAFKSKVYLVDKYIANFRPKSVWDLGANIGEFSRLSSKYKINTISFDYDHVAVEKNYLQCINTDEKYILPLLLDLTNPSPDIGWANKERSSLSSRGPSDMILALAILHHLAIRNNLPFFKIAEYLSENCNTLIIEFIPKMDFQVQKILSRREDIFDSYNKDKFEENFKIFFEILESKRLNESERIIYLMKSRQAHL